MMSSSLLDKTFRVLVKVSRNPFFQGGWGEQAALQHLLGIDPREIHNYPVGDINIQWGPGSMTDKVSIRNGWFESPFRFEWQQAGKTRAHVLPEAARRAAIQMILPRNRTSNMPLVVHFAGTGDEGFHRRRIALAVPLAERGIGSVLLENPFYGTRRAWGANGSLLNEVSVFMLMPWAALQEGVALVRRLNADGYGPLGVTGLSMGGSIALTTAASAGIPLAVSACIPSHCASAVYLDGAFRRACAWEILEAELPDQDAGEHLRAVMSLWDIRKFQLPERPDAAVILGAKRDHYIPRFSTQAIHEHWPGSVLRWIDTGHIGALLFHRKYCQDAVAESFARL